MKTFTILYLRGSVLERVEQVCVANALDAVRLAAGQAEDVTIEIWSGDRQVAMLRSTTAG